jgi:hypothetical protein
MNQFPVSSRSFEEGGATFYSTLPQSHVGVMLSTHETELIGAPPTISQSIASPALNAGQGPAPTGSPGKMHHQQQQDGNLTTQIYLQDQHAALQQQQLLLQQQQAAGAPPTISQSIASPALNAGPAPTLTGSPGKLHHQQPLDGNMAAQIYLQQQHAALQQQQLLLQQQQAALAFQQQQLQAYGIANNGGVNPHHFDVIGSAPGMSATTMSVNGGYYYVSATDGTPMLIAANPGMQGQMIQAQQFPGPFATMLGQPATSGIMSQQLPNIAAIPGMVTVPSSGIPAGMMAMTPHNNNSDNTSIGSSNGFIYPIMNNGNNHSNHMNGNPYQ